MITTEMNANEAIDNTTPEALARAIVVGCERLHGRGMLAAADGNVSVRLANDEILITPSGKAKAFITAADLARISLDGEVLSGRPSGEREMHLAVYRRCPKAKAVVHAHPPHAIAWSVAEPIPKELPNNILSEVVLAAGRIPIVPYARPGTKDMGDVLSPYLPECRLLILSRHGALAWGEDLAEALGGMERIEHSAQVLFLARAMGALKPLPESEMAELLKLRSTLGERVL